jgi:hypothetical protein
MTDGQNWNAGKSWSEMDLFDPRNGIRRGDSLADLAQFLMRSEAEVQAKMRELQPEMSQPGTSHKSPR